ncbi:MAG: hypothetical protein GC168_20515 [Candidatus Hydrogenedens sp.]|nr:hypothetical protein [Candidatus Hydrogenedens sp.]
MTAGPFAPACSAPTAPPGTAATVPPAVPPTALGLAALRVIAELTAATGIAPSYDELSGELDIASKGHLTAIVNGLVERGWIARLPGRARAIRVLHPVPLPDLATVAWELSADAYGALSQGKPGTAARDRRQKHRHRGGQP